MQTVVRVSEGEEKLVLCRRKRLPISFIVAGLAILGAVIYLIFTSTQANALYYLTVSELKSCTTCATQSVRVAGSVQAGSIVRDDQKQQISFVIADGGHTLPVVYSGIVPGIFHPRSQGVVGGHCIGAGRFQPQTLASHARSTAH